MISRARNTPDVSRPDGLIRLKIHQEVCSSFSSLPHLLVGVAGGASVRSLALLLASSAVTIPVTLL